MASHNFKAQPQEEKNTKVVIRFPVEKFTLVYNLLLIWNLSKQKVSCGKYTNQDLLKYFLKAIS